MKEQTNGSHNKAMRLLDLRNGSVDTAVSLYLLEITEYFNEMMPSTEDLEAPVHAGEILLAPA